MKDHEIAHMLETLHILAEKHDVEVNITPDGVSLWTRGDIDFTCKDINGARAIKALKALDEFFQCWEPGH